MAEFVQIMKDWRRMCKAQDDGSNRDVCATCPFGILGEGCSSIYEDDMDYAKLESVVVEWAKKHPLPKMMTFYEWLTTLINDKYKNRIVDDHDFVAWLDATPIPADIAQKLGIEPKEG